MSRTFIPSVGLAIVLVLGRAGPGAAQAWDNPSFQPPRVSHELGAAFVTPDDHDLGVVAFWRQPGSVGFGVRGGYVSGRDDAWLVGTEIFGALYPITANEPLAMMWTLGVGGAFGDRTEVSIPVGLSAGLLIPLGPGLSIEPYAHPRAALDLLIDDDTESEFRVSLDLGADIALGDMLRLRVAGTFMDRPAWGIGLAWTGLRPVDVLGR